MQYTKLTSVGQLERPLAFRSKLQKINQIFTSLGIIKIINIMVGGRPSAAIIVYRGMPCYLRLYASELARSPSFKVLNPLFVPFISPCRPLPSPPHYLTLKHANGTNTPSIASSLALQSPAAVIGLKLPRSE